MRKHHLFCNSCNNPIEIYKKGKRHKILLCPKCGVVASNPLPLAMLAPAAISAVGGLIGQKKDQGESKVHKIVTDSLDKPNKGERYVKMALGGI